MAKPGDSVLALSSALPAAEAHMATGPFADITAVTKESYPRGGARVPRYVSECPAGSVLRLRSFRMHVTLADVVLPARAGRRFSSREQPSKMGPEASCQVKKVLARTSRHTGSWLLA